MGVQQRSSQSSVNKGPQQTLSEIQRGMVARKFFFVCFFNLISVLIFLFQNFFIEHHEDSRGLKKGPNSCDTNNTNQVVRNSSEVSNSWPAQICMSGISFCFKV